MDEQLQAVTQPEETAAEETTETVSTEDTNGAETIENAEETTPSADDGESTEQVAQPITIPVKFNKQHKELTIDEAAVYAQKGMKWDDFTPTHEKMKFLAAAANMSVEQLTDALIERQDKTLKEQLLEECGGNEDIANRLYEVEKAKQQKAFDALKEQESKIQLTEQEQLNKRLANDFLELQAEIPEMATIDKVPKKVLEMAVDKDISILDAYLRYQHAEGKKTQTVKAKAETATQNSTGSMKAAPNSPSPEIDAMMKGLWG